MEPNKSDTNLLFGILAMKMNFIRQDDLLEAMGIWFLDRQKSLGEILIERQAISPKDCALLDSMVRESQAQGLVDHVTKPEATPEELLVIRDGLLGNASEWCAATLDLYRGPNQPRPREDALELVTIQDEQQVVDARGGSFLDPSADVRSANRNLRRPSERLPYFGMRLARTCPH
jgi:hypothetical protein